jgi:hypothetical protein
MKNKFLKSYLVLFLFLSGFSAVYADWKIVEGLTEYEVALNSELVTTVMRKERQYLYFYNTYKTNSYFKDSQLIRCSNNTGFYGSYCRTLSKNQD